MQLGLQHTYATLAPRFFAEVAPGRVAEPRLVAFNRPLAAELQLDPDLIEAHAAAMFSGNELPEDAKPIAMAYAGHQFGGFVPRLGDGRAILLGEIRDVNGVLRDIQLKGSGLTPFSRNGDGRAALGPMLREYLISEAMHALGIPTTRSLAVVTTGERVLREEVLPGAVLTRVAASHIRVGTFQYFAARGDQDGVRELLNYVIARHYPEAANDEVPALAVLKAVAERQAALIAKWMLVGFIHGVMNTDNMALSGETIDYGPCAFMDEYNPRTVFSSIDSNGRYAYANQAAIAQWNLARLAETLLPLIHADGDIAVSLATPVIGGFIARFDEHFLRGMRAKIGLASALDGDAERVSRLLLAMHNAGADFTLTFRRLTKVMESAENEARLLELFPESEAMRAWLSEWRQRLQADSRDGDADVAVADADASVGTRAGDRSRAERMRHANPAFIPRNHRVEAALNAASEYGDFEPFRRLLAILQRPFDDQPDAIEFETPPQPSERVLNTFCGT